jgi:putative phage-type endonuclease
MKLSPAQLAERRRFLGASEAAAAIGLSNFFSPLQLFKAKLGEGEQLEETIPIMVGHALEPVTLRLAEKELGVEIIDRQSVIYDPHNPWRRATLDGRISRTQAVEAKASGVWQNWGKDDDAVADPIIYQAQHQMACDEDLERIWIPVILAQREFRMYHVDRDEELIDLLTKGEKEFMDFVARREPPPPINTEDLKMLYPVDHGQAVMATPEIRDVAVKYAEVSQRLKALETNKTLFGDRLRMFMGDAATLLDRDGSPLVTWKSHDESRINVSLLREEEPRIAGRYTETKPVRKLLCKVKLPKSKDIGV